MCNNTQQVQIKAVHGVKMRGEPYIYSYSNVSRDLHHYYMCNGFQEDI